MTQLDEEGGHIFPALPDANDNKLDDPQQLKNSTFNRSIDAQNAQVSLNLYLYQYLCYPKCVMWQTNK